MTRLALACLAVSLLTLGLAVGLSLDVENALADEPRVPALIQARPLSQAVDLNGLENLGRWPVPRATQAAGGGGRR